jgi:sugar-specific transcriptional regulator TrmB
MAHPDDEVIEIELVNCLGELGLTEYEARALVKLRRLGTATAKDIASADGIPRTQVYDAVETLHEIGLVDIQHTTPRKYTVVSRESIIRKLNIDRENAISEAAELFEQLIVIIAVIFVTTLGDCCVTTCNTHRPVPRR